MSSSLLWSVSERRRAVPPTRIRVLQDASVLDGDAHRPGGAGDDLRGGLDVVGVEVGHLLLGDLTQLSLRDGTDLRRLRRAGALRDAGGLDQQPGGGRRLELEGERTVLVDADLSR